jgi:phosphate uptake regulator
MLRFGRRIQQIGSSFLVSLPIGWVKRNNLRKGNMVLVEINNDNTLSLFSSDLIAEEPKEVSIAYSPNSVDSIVNQIYGTYLLGYNIIRIKGHEQITFEHRDRIKFAMRKLAGLEIIEEDSTNIICQFLLDAGTLEIEKILRRMNTIIAGMYKDTIDLLGKSSEYNIRKSIVSRDAEVDRQYFLLVRLIRSAMLDQQLATKLNLSNIDILDYRIAANHLENAGDYIKDFAKTLPHLESKELLNEIIQASLLTVRMQEKSVAAFINNNRIESSDIVKLYNKFNQLMDSIKELSTHRNGLEESMSSISLLNSVYSMDKIARCWVDVADLVKPAYSKYTKRPATPVDRTVM